MILCIFDDSVSSSSSPFSSPYSASFSSSLFLSLLLLVEFLLRGLANRGLSATPKQDGLCIAELREQRERRQLLLWLFSLLLSLAMAVRREAGF